MRVLVTGAGGQVGSEIVALLAAKAEAKRRGPGLEVLAATRAELDVSVRDSVLAAIVGAEPDVVIHAAAWTAVDACESDPGVAFAVNALGTRNVAEAARIVGAHLCYLSTDYVFDGEAARPYAEWDQPCPLNAYGRSKLAGENQLDPATTVVRTAWVSGRNGPNMVKTVIKLARMGGEMSFVDDQRGSPTVARDLAGRVVELAMSRRPGLYHVTNQGSATWYELARAVVGYAGEDPARVRPVTTAELEPRRPAPRPAFSVLDNAALRLGGEELLSDWETAVEQLVMELVGGNDL